MRSLLFGLTLASSLFRAANAQGFPEKIYGVCLGSWLVLEPWMLPAGWLAMGGESCNDCSTCINSEFAFAKAYPDTVDQTFATHWETWFNQPDVDKFVELGLNTVRIPLGYWIVEDLVDRETEFYPRGGLKQLRRGLQQLNKAGIVAILDHHALPGVQDPGQQFTGLCTSDVEFYTPYNYHRALVWTAVMTALSHVDPAFSNAVAIEAVNEPIMNATLTPGYGDFQKNFVLVIRAVELLLGVPLPVDSNLDLDINVMVGANVTASLASVAQLPSIFTEVREAVQDAVPILIKIAIELGLTRDFFAFSGHKKDSLVTNFMDINWQYNNPPNPADAAIGPQIYDNHLYYSFGGVANATEDAYLEHNCNLDRIQADAALNNSPLFFGGKSEHCCDMLDLDIYRYVAEWSLATQFNATDAFLRKWADSQKRAYGMGAGWIFWNFKIEESELAGETARQWSYVKGVELGYLTKDPSHFNDPHVCDPYLNTTAA